jgi:prophage regulatory protein
MPTRFLRLPTVLERTGYSRPRLYARISDGLFPRSISLGPRVVARTEHEVDAVIAAHIRALADDELAQLVSEIHAQRSTFGLGGSADIPATTASESSAA